MFWNYMVQSAFETFWSIKGMWWAFKFLCILAYTAVSTFVSIFFWNYLGFWAIVLLALCIVDFIIFVIRMVLACSITFEASRKKSAIANASGALLLVKIILRALGVCALLVSTLMLVQISANPFALCIVLLVYACLLACFVFWKELVFTVYKYIKYLAKREMKAFRERTEKLIGAEQYHDANE